MKKIKSLLISLAMLVSVLPMAGFRTAESTAPARRKPAAADLVVSAANNALASGLLRSLSEEIPGENNPDEILNGNEGGNLEGSPEENLNEGPEINVNETFEENVNAYREENLPENTEIIPPPADPQTVTESLEQAIADEQTAANESSVNDVQVLERRAENFEREAISYVENAVNTKETAEKEIEEYKDNAHDAAEIAFNDAVDASKQNRAAQTSAEDAAKQESIAENTCIKPISQHAALEAEKDARTAENAAAQALIDKEEAEKNAAEARENYEKAQKAYDDAKAAIDEDLKNGLISAEEAVKRTELAEREAKFVYDAVLVAEAAAAATREEAERQLGQATAELNEAVENLNDAIEENGKEVLKDTGIAAATGAALAVVKIVTDAAERTVDNYNNEIDVLNEDISDLRAQITAAEEELQKAKDAVSQLDEDKEAAEKELEAAAEALEYAKKIESVASEINAYRQDAALADANRRMEELQALVDKGEATLEDERELTELVIETIGKTREYQILEQLPVGEVKWLDDNPAADERIFALDDGETTSYYMMTRNVVEDEETGETHAYLQYTKVEYKSLDSINKEQFFDNSSSGYQFQSTVPTGLTASDGTNAYEVSIEKFNIIFTVFYRYVVEVDGKTWEVKGNENDGYYYETGSGKNKVKHPLTVDEKMEPTEDKLINDSDTITKLWADAANAETLVSDSEARDQAAKEEILKDYVVNYESIREALVETQGLKQQLLEEIHDSVDPEIKETQDKIDALEETRDGGLVDKILVAVMNNVENGEDSLTIDKGLEVLDTVANLNLLNIVTNPSILNTLGDVGTVLWENRGDILDTDWSGFGEDISAVMNIYSQIQNNEVNAETVTAALDLISDLKAAPQTKYAAASMIERIVAKWHHDAVENLQDAVENGLREVEEQTAAVAEAGMKAAEKKLVLEVAEAAEKLAQSLADEAETEYKAAREANKQAKAARDQVKALIDSGYGLDDSRVKEAKMYAVIAEASAKTADQAYKDAEKAAKDARVSANNARKAARKLRDPYFYPYVPAYMPVSHPHHNPHVPAYTPAMPVHYPCAPAPAAPAYMPAAYPMAISANIYRPGRRMYFFSLRS